MAQAVSRDLHYGGPGDCTLGSFVAISGKQSWIVHVNHVYQAHVNMNDLPLTRTP